MQSRTSSSNMASIVSRPVLVKNLSRFWPLWAVYAAIWLAVMPLTQFTTLFSVSRSYQGFENLALQSNRIMLEMGMEVGMGMALVFGCLFAMALFSYQCSARSVGMFHSFPVRREALFWANYLSGCVVFLAVLAAAGLLTAMVQAAAGALMWKYLLIWFACAAGQMLFFYSFAVLCAMFTGQVLAIPAFYGILNGLAFGLQGLVLGTFAGTFLYGYKGDSFLRPVEWLTPLLQLSNSLRTSNVWDDGRNQIVGLEISGLGTVAVYAAVGAVMAVLALAACRLRRSETAGDIVVFSWARKLFRVGVGVCLGLSLGQLLYLLLNEVTGRSLPLDLILIGLCCLVGYFAAEMLLKKSFRVFRGAWKGAAVTAAILVAVMAGVGLDVAGVENRMPAADAVAEVSYHLYGDRSLGGITENPSDIDGLLQLHSLLIQDKDRQRSLDNRYDLLENWGRDGFHNGSFQVTYTLQNGSHLTRRYSFYYNAEDLNNPASPAAAAQALVRRPSIQRNALGLEPERAALILENMTSGQFTYPTNIDENGWESSLETMDADTARAVFRALLEDIDAGRAGGSMFRPDGYRDCYENDLSFSYYDTSVNSYRDYDSRQLYDINFTPEYTSTIDALKAAGVVTEERPLLTRRQIDEAVAAKGGAYYGAAAGSVG